MNFSDKRIEEGKQVMQEIDSHCEQYAADKWAEYQMRNGLSDLFIEKLKDKIGW